ncbi:MAG: M42 family metallopeptidase [Defluviitaleaceae bacterium]|nr:M42 family metallopeptidase [Defluviitaleaceae bacterium]
MNFPVDYFKQTLCEILAVDSPSGYTAAAVAKLKTYVDKLGYENYVTKKGNLVINVAGKSDKTIGISAHLDTLGLVVRGYRGNGTLSFSQVGGAILPTLDGEYCKIYTRWSEKPYTGTILSNSPSSHVYDDAGSAARNDKGMHVKLDEIVSNDNDVKKLGILPGDFICYAPKTEITENGFIKSRFLDDKMSVAIILSMLKYFKDNNIMPAHNILSIFSTYEEVGHGLCHLPQPVDEFVALDMGCIGDDLSCTEYDVSICAKDSSGPYDYELTTRLIKLAKDAGLGFAVDIYPRYGSDVSAARYAGHDFKGALIGPGVAASHGMERSHMKAAENTWKLLHLYLTQ